MTDRVEQRASVISAAGLCTGRGGFGQHLDTTTTSSKNADAFLMLAAKLERGVFVCS